MIKKEDLFNATEEKYHKMLSMVNIPNFTKCIAQFSGLGVKEVSEAVLIEYLKTWAKNKYRFFIAYF